MRKRRSLSNVFSLEFPFSRMLISTTFKFNRLISRQITKARYLMIYYYDIITKLCIAIDWWVEKQGLPTSYSYISD